MKIYTKTGDQGETSLFTGERVSKAHSLVESYGMLDELNTEIGLLVHNLKSIKNSENIESESLAGEKNREGVFSKDTVFLESIQSQIFSLGSYLASNCEQKKHLIEISNWVSAQENQMDQKDEQLKPLKNFILPGGAGPACVAHSCRVLTRKVERFVVSLGLSDDGVAQVVLYLNRLSDYFFVLSRWINFQLKVEEPIWKT